MDLLSTCRGRHVSHAKGVQQGFCRRTAGGARGIGRRQACYALLLLCQTAATSLLHQTRGQREHVHEPCGADHVAHPWERARGACRSLGHTRAPPAHEMRHVCADMFLPVLRDSGELNRGGRPVSEKRKGGVKGRTRTRSVDVRDDHARQAGRGTRSEQQAYPRKGMDHGGSRGDGRRWPVRERSPHGLDFRNG